MRSERDFIPNEFHAFFRMHFQIYWRLDWWRGAKHHLSLRLRNFQRWVRCDERFNSLNDFCVKRLCNLFFLASVADWEASHYFVVTSERWSVSFSAHTSITESFHTSALWSHSFLELFSYFCQILRDIIYRSNNFKWEKKASIQGWPSNHCFFSLSSQMPESGSCFKVLQRF